jgi:hypothetical protein
MTLVDIIASLLTSSVVAAIVGGFVAMRTSERQIEIQNVTQERAKWRDKIRANTRGICQAIELNDHAKIKEFRLIFAVNLNPIDYEDNEIIAIIDRLEKIEELKAGEESSVIMQELSVRIALLLKHDWERAKFEAKAWWKRIFDYEPGRVSYFEFLELKRQGFPRPWFHTPK